MHLLDLRTDKYLSEKDAVIEVKDNQHIAMLEKDADFDRGSSMILLSAARDILTKKEIILHLGNGFDLIIDGKEEVQSLANACKEALGV